MSPHNDAPSPNGSFTNGNSFNGLSVRSQAVQHIFNQAHFDNFETSSVESMDIHRPLLPGIYVPTVAFFDSATEDVDVKTTSTHAVRLAEAGVAGITTQGSNGEAVHLSHKERSLVTRTTRKALDDAGFGYMPIIVGCGAQSTKETIELCNEAAADGGDYALVLPPGYYQGLFSKDTIVSFFKDVASASPVPILIYNYPGAVSGLDLNSDAIIELAQHHNIVGCKLTCGNTGKLNRVAAATRAATMSEPGSGFMCMGGSVDFTLQTLIGGGSGVIGGMANIAPKACVKLMNLFEAGELKEARRLQAIVARGDWAAIQGGIIGTKAALMAHFGYGGYARKPLPKPSKEETRKWRDAFEELVKLEKSL
ncbi:aldolase [Lophium mytilinum]|uniref:Aldolase n=1 Tax=Lophium mytilinum TaxID=390894 RepID=A0A6A6R2B1_9PEZI|nr:aldolase [Lophium mytilinum]